MPSRRDSRSGSAAACQLRRRSRAALFYNRNLASVASREELLEVAHEEAAIRPRGEWITGRGFSVDRWPERTPPDRWGLDRVAPDHPVAFNDLGTRTSRPSSTPGTSIGSGPRGLRTGFGDRVKLGPIKVIVDGWLDTRTSANYEPYADAPRLRGYCWREEDPGDYRELGGSDCHPCEPQWLAPLGQIYLYSVEGPLNPANRFTRAEAVAMFTTEAAKASYQDREKGRIRPGALADLVVLSDDPLTVEDTQLPSIPVLRTIVGGENGVAPRRSAGRYLMGDGDGGLIDEAPHPLLRHGLGDQAHPGQ